MREQVDDLAPNQEIEDASAVLWKSHINYANAKCENGDPEKEDESSTGSFFERIFGIEFVSSSLPLPFRRIRRVVEDPLKSFVALNNEELNWGKRNKRR